MKKTICFCEIKNRQNEEDRGIVKVFDTEAPQDVQKCDPSRPRCELSTVGAECVYRFYTAHIPTACGAMPNGGEVCGRIRCDSDKDAEQCLLAIARLIEKGYGDAPNWYIGLDMGDILTHIFNGRPMRYIQKTPRDASIALIEQRVKGAKFLFTYWQLPADSDIGSYCDEIGDRFEKAAGAPSAWTQLELTTNEPATVAVWYG